MTLIETVKNIVTRKPKQPVEPASKASLTAEQAAVLTVLHEVNQPLKELRLKVYTFLVDDSLNESYSLYDWNRGNTTIHSPAFHFDIERMELGGLVNTTVTKTTNNTTQKTHEITETGVEAINEFTYGRAVFGDIPHYVTDITDEHAQKPLSNLINDVLTAHDEYDSLV